MKSLANRPLLIIAAGFMPILLLQILTMRQDDAVVMSLIAATDGVSLLLATLLALHLMRRPEIASPVAAANRPVPGCGSPACTAPSGRATAARSAVATAFDSGRQAMRTALDSTPEPAAAMIDRVYRLAFGKSLADVFRNRCPELLVLPFSYADPEPCQTDASARRRAQPGAGAGQAALPPGRQVTLCRAITEKQQATTALRDSEQRLRLALAGARMGVCELDLVTGAASCTPEAAAILGRDQHDHDTLDTWFAAIHPDDQAAVRASWDRALADAENDYAVEYRFRQPDGGWRWIGSCGRVMFDSGRPVRVVSLVQDISVRKAVEAELHCLTAELQARVATEVAAREAAQAWAAHAERMHALGQLAGGIAHDFNNVLQSVSGAITLVARHPGSPADLSRVLRMAEAATRRGAAITRRLLAFSRRSELAAEPIGAADLLHDLREILVHTLGPNIEVAIQLGPALAPFVADRSQLETSLINLATNARDAMPRGGKLSLSASVETVGQNAPPHAAGLAPGGYMRLGVADSGTGMDAATLARATESFFTTKAAGVGTGLGLAMCKAFTEQSGGGMTVASCPGEGTTVTLWLPMAAADAAPAARHTQTDDAPAPAVASGPVGAVGGPKPRPRVLLVDDDTLLRETLALMLTDIGYRVVQATDGHEALALLADNQAVDALVTDLSMPGLDGLAVIRAAQAHRPGLPAVLLTGSADDVGAPDGSGPATGRAGTYALLRKPATGPQFAACLAALLRPPRPDRAAVMDIP